MFKVSQFSKPESKEIVVPITHQEKNLLVQNPFKFVITQQPQIKKKNKLVFLKGANLQSNSENGRWSREEHNRFIEAIIIYGNDWKKVQKHVATRTSTQARSHAQKFLMKLRHCEHLKKKKIDLSFSWAKAIQFIKKEFTTTELTEILSSVSTKKHGSKKKCLSKKLDINSEDLNTVETVSTEDECSYSQFSSSLCEEVEEGKLNFKSREDNEYVQTFIQNFQVKSDDFDFDDIDICYKAEEKNINY